MAQSIAVICPVFDDWESFQRLVVEMSEQMCGHDIRLHMLAVDDGSRSRFDVNTIALPPDTCIAAIELVCLAANLGHQRAIAVGLSEIFEREDFDAAIVMDSDGEDRPADALALVAAGNSHPEEIVLARRSKRSEGRAFRVGYVTYKLLFRLATGLRIDFGNFCLLPMPAVRRLVHMPELWNNLAGSIIRSRLSYRTIPTIRGRRYAGASRMNFIGLIGHGLSAMSVHIDTIFVRLLVAAAFGSALLLAAMGIAAALRLATDLATPGWATTVVAASLTLLMQMILLVSAAALLQMATRSTRPMIPAKDCSGLVDRKIVRVIAR